MLERAGFAVEDASYGASVYAGLHLRAVSGAAEVVVREAGAADAAAVADLRAAWAAADVEDPTFAARMADWLAAEGERRTTWLAWLDGAPVGLASLFEYRDAQAGLPPRPGATSGTCS